MKTQTTFFRKQIPAVLVFLVAFAACYHIDFVNQPYSAEPNSSFEVEVSVSKDPGGG
jgi:hypothetical protein